LREAFDRGASPALLLSVEAHLEWVRAATSERSDHLLGGLGEHESERFTWRRACAICKTPFKVGDEVEEYADGLACSVCVYFETYVRPKS
jgi:hypothetical protein